MVLGIEVGLSPNDFVLDGDPAPLRKKGAEPPPQFSAHFYCGETAGRIKMPRGMEVGLSQGFCIRRGSSPSQKGGSGAEPLPNFWPISIVVKRLDALRCHLVRR